MTTAILWQVPVLYHPLTQWPVQAEVHCKDLEIAPQFGTQCSTAGSTAEGSNNEN